MRWIIPFIACSFAIILPWRLRHWFIKVMAYSAQAVYFLAGSLIKFILRNLGEKKDKHE